MAVNSLFIAASVLAAGPGSAAATPGESMSSPWRHEDNNDSVEHGLAFTESDADNLADFHGTPRDPKLA